MSAVRRPKRGLTQATSKASAFESQARHLRRRSATPRPKNHEPRREVKRKYEREREREKHKLKRANHE
jgi:hypothetical protein